MCDLSEVHIPLNKKRQFNSQLNCRLSSPITKKPFDRSLRCWSFCFTPFLLQSFLRLLLKLSGVISANNDVTSRAIQSTKLDCPLKSLITKEGVYSMLELIIIPIVTGIAVTVLSAIVLRYLDRKSNDNETQKSKQ